MGPRPSAGENVEDQGESAEDHEPQPPHHLDTGLGGISYTQAEVDALSGTVGFMYIAWLGKYVDPPPSRALSYIPPHKADHPHSRLAPPRHRASGRDPSRPSRMESGH
jgi:hypothetical protein